MCTKCNLPVTRVQLNGILLLSEYLFWFVDDERSIVTVSFLNGMKSEHRYFETSPDHTDAKCSVNKTRPVRDTITNKNFTKRAQILFCITIDKH
jgi:hypothetical protein